jgi:hypothetical protein
LISFLVFCRVPGIIKSSVKLCYECNFPCCNFIFSTSLARAREVFSRFCFFFELCRHQNHRNELFTMLHSTSCRFYLCRFIFHAFFLHIVFLSLCHQTFNIVEHYETNCTAAERSFFLFANPFSSTVN